VFLILIFKWRKYRRVCCYSLTGREKVISLILSHVKCCKCFYLKFSHDFIVSVMSTSLLSREVWPFVGLQELCDIIKAKKRAVDGVRVTSWTSTLPLPREITHGVGHSLCNIVALGKVMLSTWFQHWSQFHTFPARPPSERTQPTCSNCTSHNLEERPRSIVLRAWSTTCNSWILTTN